jgi:6-phosphogluconate dehydrogenase
MIGVGSMGGSMSLLFAEHGVEVNFYDPSEDNVKALLIQAKEAKREDKIVHQKDYKALCEALDKPRVFVFSIPHGNVGDKTVEGLEPYMEKGDIIMDASNEYWLNTERRQKKLRDTGIHYIGMGVSGGYQSARHGPSISPGGDKEALDNVMPFLRKVAAKDKNDRPCTTEVGPHGSGHYVKMVHNGIEQGMMSTLCEVWMIMNQSLGMTYEEIADTWEQWNKSGPLHDNFFIDIGVDICRTKDPEDNSKFLLANVRDKVVQDVDETEGTGTWTCQEAVALHVSAPTITAAHLFRLQSADAARRIAVEKALPRDPHGRPKKLKLEAHMPLEPFLEDLRQATYFSFLAAFIQGLHLIAAASAKYEWNIDFAGLIQLWRGGCIIQSDGIADLLENAYRDGSHSKTDLLEHSSITNELVDSYSAIKNVVLKCTEADCYIPSISASLEYFKYSSSTELPTQFMEAELDFFGGHMFDLKSAEPGKPVTGKSIHNNLLMNILT